MGNRKQNRRSRRNTNRGKAIKRALLHKKRKDETDDTQGRSELMENIEIVPSMNDSDKDNVTHTTGNTLCVQTPERTDYSFISEKEFDSVMDHELCVEKESPKNKESSVLPGHRIVDLGYVLKWAMNIQMQHSKICTSGKMRLKNEKRVGLISVLNFKCDMCDYEVTKSTEDPKNKKSKINYGAVWGTISTGSTYTHFKERLSVLDIPSMSYRLFHKIELEVGDKWKSHLWETIEEAGQQEYSLALERNQVDKNNVVWTKVYADGGWSHRSYGHNYNAASGTAVIIGELTKQVLFLGVRNKYCSICEHAINKGAEPKQHICFKNWSESSGAMEADIIVEGFRESQKMHNLKYLKFVADGDSSVYAKIKQNVPYGDEVQKIECKNHAIKNYGSALHKIKNDVKINILGRKFLNIRIIKQLQSTALKQLEANANGDIEQLKKDWSNGPNHVFGNHTNCNVNYCNIVGDTTNNSIPKLEESGIHLHINAALDRLISKAHKLITNETNNCSELFMSYLAKYNAAKRLNLTQRGSFETRAHMSGLKYNKGFRWQADPWKELMDDSPGKNFKKFLSLSIHSQELRAKRKLNLDPDENKSGKKKRKRNNTSTKNYGPKAVQAPLNNEEFISEKNRILRNMQMTPADIKHYERSTVGQWDNPLYEQIRKNRLTASNFGRVIKRRRTTCPDNLVKIILGKSTANSPAIEYGKIKESVARQKFAALKPSATIQQSGIFVYEKYGYLAASPDGLVGNNAILEIKCLHKVHKSGKTLEEAVRTDKTLCVEMVDGKIKLKKNHNYYYQVQGQLNITKKDICFFIIYINDEEPLYVEAIRRNESLWENTMLPKLTNFYEDYILKAIINKPN